MASKAATKVLLTKEEQALLKNMTPATQALFNGRTADETLTSFENEEELVHRMSSASYDKFPEVAQVIEKFSKTANVDDLALEKLSDGAIETLLYSIGACGICAIVETAMQTDQFDRDGVEAIAVLTTVRHKILEKNAAK